MFSHYPQSPILVEYNNFNVNVNAQKKEHFVRILKMDIHFPTPCCVFKTKKCKATTTDMKNLNRKIKQHESSGVKKKIMPPNS